MNHKASKSLGIFLLAVISLGLGYYGWYYYMGPGQNKLVNTDTAKTTTTTDTTTTPKSNATETPTTTTEKTSTENTFAKQNFGFTFKYPANWTLVSAESSNQGSSIVSQKTVKIKSDKNIEFRFDNPTVATGFEEYDLKNPKDIIAGSLTFKRNYGSSATNQILYVATYNDPNNLDGSSVSFYGIGELDLATIEALDKIVASFSFS